MLLDQNKKYSKFKLISEIQKLSSKVKIQTFNVYDLETMKKLISELNKKSLIKSYSIIIIENE